MFMARRVKLVRHLMDRELEDLYRSERELDLRERLQAILLLYDGMKVKEVARILRRPVRTVEGWVHKWNEDGVEGLRTKPHTGRKPLLPYNEWERVLKEIEGKGMTVRDVMVYVNTSRGVEYGYKTIWWVLRKKMRARYGKPYMQEERRPPDAEENLKKGCVRR